jgi:CRP-like cAMP-binding protein
MLSTQLMRAGAKPQIKKFKAATVLLREGEPGDELVLVLDGVVRAHVGGRRLADYGPGSIHGERALLEGGLRTATITTVSPAMVAIVPADGIDPAVLAELREGHRREEQP